MTLYIRNFFNDDLVTSIELSRKLTDEEREAIQSEIEANPDEEPDWDLILWEAVCLHAPSALDNVEKNSQTINVQI